MSQSSLELGLFEWLKDEYIERLVVKLNALPSGEQFQKKAVEDLESKLGVSGSDRAYEDIYQAHGALIGLVEGDQNRLPWWLNEFEWTVDSDQLSPLAISVDTLDEFEEYPRDSTYIESIELNGAETFRKTLSALVDLEGKLNSALQLDPVALEEKYDIDTEQYKSPDQFFELPDSGVATTQSAEEWFNRVLNLCPPAEPTLTALLRTNVNVERQHASEALDEDNIQQLVDLEIIDTDDQNERVFDEDYYENLTQLLETKAPFDLTIDLDHEKDRLTPLQYLYYRSWATDVDRRLPEEQRWLQAVKNQADLSEGEQFRFASYAFRMPLRLDSNQPVFTHQKKYGASSTVRQQILELLAEHGHPADND